MSAPFGEAAVLNDGRRVIAPWLSRGIYLGDQFHDGPVIRMPDAALTASGHVWVAGKNQHDGGASVWLDAVGIWWQVPYKVFGGRLILRADGEGCQIAFTTSATSWLCVKVTAGGSMSIASSGTIPSGEGAQGMRDWLLGTPRPMAPLDQTLLGHKVRAEVTVGTVTLATALGPLPDQVVMAQDGKLGTLLQGSVDWPTLRISPNERYWVGAMYVGERVVGGSVPAVVPALVTGQPSTPPPPPPETTMHAPKVTEIRFDGLFKPDGWHLVTTDGNGNTIDTFTKDGVIHQRITNALGFNEMSDPKRRIV